MNADNSHPLFGPGIDLIEMVIDHVPSPAVAIHDKAIGSVGKPFVCRPAIEMHLARNARHRGLQFLRQKLAPGVVLVRPVSMAGLAGDEDDLLLRCLRRRLLGGKLQGSEAHLDYDRH
jgi:hypothetical protein